MAGSAWASDVLELDLDVASVRWIAPHNPAVKARKEWARPSGLVVPVPSILETCQKWRCSRCFFFTALGQSHCYLCGKVYCVGKGPYDLVCLVVRGRLSLGFDSSLHKHSYGIQCVGVSIEVGFYERRHCLVGGYCIRESLALTHCCFFFFNSGLSFFHFLRA